MGIYIPGMEMPKPDEVIRIYNNGEARKCPLFEQKVIEVSVAIPISPHGRLIDADALETEAQERMLICNKQERQFQRPYEIMRAITLAPIIIPADKEEQT